MTKRRDRKYYKDRLEKEHPALYAKVRSGELSVRAASAKAGLIHLPTRFDALKREWKKASGAERSEFGRWLKTTLPKRAPKPIADTGGILRPDVRVFLQGWLSCYGSRAGRIMKVMGFKVFDPTLNSAIVGGHALRSEVIPPLTLWLRSQGFRG